MMPDYEQNGPIDNRDNRNNGNQEQDVVDVDNRMFQEEDNRVREYRAMLNEAKQEDMPEDDDVDENDQDHFSAPAA